eukprot:g2892.t1
MLVSPSNFFNSRALIWGVHVPPQGLFSMADGKAATSPIKPQKPSKPDMKLVEALVKQPDIVRAAKAIQAVDALYVGTGAGMGVSSGLGTFRGKTAGIWPPLKKLGIDFTQMSNPKWFTYDKGMHQRSINFAWSFWHFRYQAYTTSEPHPGYGYITDWCKKMPLGGFSFTSNIDGHWEAAGFPVDRILECHGSVHFMQCASGCSEQIWPVTTEFNMEIDHATDCAKEPLPKCKHCDQGARPNVLMFGDWHFLPNRHDLQETNRQKWEARLEKYAVEKKDRSGKKGAGQPVELVVLEIGAGSAVPAVRYNCEAMARKRASTFIRINPDEPKIGSMPSRCDKIEITDDSLAVLTAIDQLLQAQHDKEKPRQGSQLGIAKKTQNIANY